MSYWWGKKYLIFSLFIICLEKKHHQQNVIHEISNENKLLTEDDNISAAMFDYYENLFSSKLISTENINVNFLNTLFNIDKNMCDAYPSMNECKEEIWI